MEPPPLTCHVYVSDGAQKAHVVVVVVSVEVRVVEDLQRSVTFPRRDVCNADSVHHHQPVGRLKHVVPAETAARHCSLWRELELRSACLH